MVAIFKLSKPNLSPNRKSVCAETWWEALKQHGNSELLKSFRSDLQHGRQSGHLETLQMTSAPELYVGLSWNVVGSIGKTWRFRIAKIVPFRYPNWPPRRPSWNSSNDIFSQTVCWIEPKLNGRQCIDRDSELLKSFWSDIQDGRAAILKIFKPHLL